MRSGGVGDENARVQSRLIRRFGGLLIGLSLAAVWSMAESGPADSTPAPAAVGEEQHGVTPVGDDPLPLAELERDGRFMRGLALGLYDKRPGADYDEALREIAEIGSDTVSLVVTWSQTDVRATTIGPDTEETREDAIVARAIDDAHDLGLRVMLFPILRIQHRDVGDWRGTVAPVDPEAWFERYRRFILHYAELAEAHRVEVFSVGSELGSMERYGDFWRDLIGRTRRVYSGQVLYSANWDHYQQTPFWDEVDLIGLTAYYELTDSQDEPVILSVLRERWGPIREEILGFMGAHDQPFVFTELGYYSQRGTAWHPWDYTRSGPVDLDQQYLCYRAFYEVWKDVPEMGGVFFWHWYGEGGPEDNSYNPRGKPAADIIRHWYTQWPSPARVVP